LRKSFFNDRSSHRVSETVGGGSKTVQQPIDGQNQTDVLDGQSDRVEYDQHGDQSSLWNSCGADGGKRRGHGDDRLASDSQIKAQCLGDKDRSDRFVKSRSIHVDGGAEGDHKLGRLF